jgi:hypothetical protein
MKQRFMLNPKQEKQLIRQQKFADEKAMMTVSTTLIESRILDPLFKFIMDKKKKDDEECPKQ